MIGYSLSVLFLIAYTFLGKYPKRYTKYKFLIKYSVSDTI